MHGCRFPCTWIPMTAWKRRFPASNSLARIIPAGVAAALLSAASLAGAAGKLSIQRLAVHQFEDGPEMAPTHEFLPGETVYISCRISGFQQPKEDEHVKLEWTLAATDPAGIPFEKAKSGVI